MKNPDDDSPPRSIIAIEVNLWPTQWPSDALIVFDLGQGGDKDLWMVNLSDPDSARSEAYLSSEADLGPIVVSRDGTLAAYQSNESGQYEIYIRSFPDPGERTLVSEGGWNIPFWSPDGSTLYYARGNQLNLPGTGGRAAGCVCTFIAARIQRDPVPVVVSTDSLFTVTSINEPSSGSGLHPDGDRWIVVQNVGTAGPEGGASEPQRLILVQNFFEELRQVVPD